MINIDDDLKATFSKNVRNMMVQKGLSERDLCLTTGISQAAMNRIKKGAVCPNLFHANLISTALEVRIDDLLKNQSHGNEEPPHIPVFSLKSIAQGKKDATGCLRYNGDIEISNVFSIVVDDALSCSLFSRGSSLVLSKINNLSLDDGDILLVRNNNEYIIGSVKGNYIYKIDDQGSKFTMSPQNILGKIIKVESQYIKKTQSDKTTVNIDHIRDIMKLLAPNTILNTT